MRWYRGKGFCNAKEPRLPSSIYLGVGAEPTHAHKCMHKCTAGIGGGRGGILIKEQERISFYLKAHNFREHLPLMLGIWFLMLWVCQDCTVYLPHLFFFFILFRALGAGYIKHISDVKLCFVFYLDSCISVIALVANSAVRLLFGLYAKMWASCGGISSGTLSCPSRNLFFFHLPLIIKNLLPAILLVWGNYVHFPLTMLVQGFPLVKEKQTSLQEKLQQQTWFKLLCKSHSMWAVGNVTWD